MAANRNARSLTSTFIVLLIFLIRQSALASSSPGPAGTAGHCSWSWHHVGNICWKSVSSAGLAGGADDFTDFCAGHGAHVLVVGSTYICVKDAKASSSSSSRRAHRGLMEVIEPHAKRFMGNVGF